MFAFPSKNRESRCGVGRVRAWMLLIGLLASLTLAGCDGAEKREAAHFERGKALFAEGNLAKARIEFKNTMQINPLNVEALYYLGLIAEKEKHFNAAFGAFAKVVEQNPKHIGGNIRYGRYLLLAGKLDDALARAETVLALEPDNAESHALRGAVYLQKGNLAEARAEALAARKADPASVNALTLLVGVLRKEGKQQEAVAELKKGLAADPKNVSLWRVLVEIYRLENDLAGVRAAYGEIIKLEPDVYRHRVELARLLIRAGHKKDAEEVLRQGVSARPAELEPKEILAEFLIEQSTFAAAEKQIKAFIAADPKINTFRFSLARLYAKHRKFKDAETVLHEIEKDASQPDVLKAKATLARFRLQANDTKAARALVDSVLAVEPVNADALTTRARLLLHDGKDVEAIAVLRTVLRDNPKSVEALRLLAESHLRARNLDLAADSLRKVLAVAPGDDATRMQLIRIYTQRKNYDEALQLLEQSILRAPNSLALQARKVELLIAKRDVRRALETAKQMQARPEGKNSPLTQYAVGRALQAAGRHELAVRSFERVLGEKPDSAAALRGFVGSKVAMKHADEAIAYLEGIRKEKPDDVYALNMLGSLYAYSKAFDKAEAAFTQASVKKPNWRSPYINLGKLMLAEKKPQQAVHVLEQGLEKVPNDSAIQFVLGIAHLSSGAYDAAISDYEAVLAKNPKNAMAANNIAAIIADHQYDNPERLDHALRLVQSQQNSKNPYFLDTLGWVHYRKGDYSLAILFLKQAVEARPNHAYMNYHLAMAYYKGGDTDAARAHLEKAVVEGASYPELDKAKALLKSMM